MVNLGTEQQAGVAVLEEVHEEVMDAKRLLERRVREQFQSEMNALLRRQSRQANICLNLGIPKTRIGRALGTSDWRSINETLAIAADEFATTSEPEADPKIAEAEAEAAAKAKYDAEDEEFQRQVLAMNPHLREQQQQEHKPTVENDEFLAGVWANEGRADDNTDWDSEE